MALPYKVATLLYCFNERDEILLLERTQEPNLGFWSPCGGKLHMHDGESPYACACREAARGIGDHLSHRDLHLAGLVSEHGYQGQTPLADVPVRGEAAAAPSCRPCIGKAASSSFKRKRSRDSKCRKRTWNKSGPGFGSIAADFLPPIAIATPTGATIGPWRNPAHGREPIIDLQSDHYFMGEALRQAGRAFEAEEVPVGAVVVRDGRIIARAFNQVEMLKDATAHAEMLAITQAEEAVGDWRLTDCTLYVTKEPCPMCAGAIVHVRLARIVFGASDPKAGAAGSALNLLQFPSLNHSCAITSGVRQAECRALLQTFFAEQRLAPLSKPFGQSET